MAEKKYYAAKDAYGNDIMLTEKEALAVLKEALGSGEVQSIETGTVSSITETRSGVTLKFWVGTQAQYDALTTPEQNVFYIISDDSEYANLSASIAQNTQDISDLEVRVDVMSATVKNNKINVENLIDSIKNIYTEFGEAYDKAFDVDKRLSMVGTVLVDGTTGIYSTPIENLDKVTSIGVVLTAGDREFPIICSRVGDLFVGTGKVVVALPGALELRDACVSLLIKGNTLEYDYTFYVDDNVNKPTDISKVYCLGVR